MEGALAGLEQQGTEVVRARASETLMGEGGAAAGGGGRAPLEGGGRRAQDWIWEIGRAHV